MAFWKFFSEQQPDYSLGRLLCFMAMLTSIALAFFTAKDILAGTFLSAAIAGKVAQKFGEK